MARAKSLSTPIDDIASKASSNWLLLANVPQRWRARSSKDAKDKLDALLCDPETRTKICHVDANGEETGAVSFPDTEFWQGRLVLVPDEDGGDDHLVVDKPAVSRSMHYGDPHVDYYSPDGHWKFYVRRLDVERWERLRPELAPKTTAGAEARAIERLTPLLKTRGDAMSKDEAWEECNQFNISRVGFDDRVWPTARDRAGLQRKAPAGRNPREPEDIKPIVDQIVGPEPNKKSRRKSRS
jgi:hypothetical protein